MIVENNNTKSGAPPSAPPPPPPEGVSELGELGDMGDSMDSQPDFGFNMELSRNHQDMYATQFDGQEDQHESKPICVAPITFVRKLD